MPKWPDLASGFKLLREVDLNAIRRRAESPFYLAVLGGEGVNKSLLISQLLTGPRAQESGFIPRVYEYGLDGEMPLGTCTLAILMVGGSDDCARERDVFKQLRRDNIPVIVCYSRSDLPQDGKVVSINAQGWQDAETVVANPGDRQSLTRMLAPAMLRACPGREVQLARNLPMLREAVCHKLIDDACLVNSTYSLATGLAEINVFLDLPLNMADIVILTKNQAIMAYKISLAMGLTGDWKETVPKMTAVVGSAFLWRQAARLLVGLIPAYGVVPKIAVAYAGTYTVGQAIYQWCAKGEKLKTENLRALYLTALKRGREAAQAVIARRKALRHPQPGA
ncbi:MAG: hypothetical protein PHU70_04930 [Dehalococcoidia bacterium]|nr:hypothetical protein [Dehalococcoidia bacterium]MDD5647648.1 hypothetical protein [Dehalococcoidia bacterium]